MRMNDAQPVILQRRRAMGTSAHRAITLQSQQWAGLTWSPWMVFDEAADGHNIPAAAGLYRFRIRGQSGLLYIGEGANLRRRLKVLNKARRMDPAHYLSWPPGT
jgi:hypothetical protein